MRGIVNASLTFTIIFSLALILHYSLDSSITNIQNLIARVLGSIDEIKDLRLDSNLPYVTAQPIKSQIGLNLIYNDGKTPNAVTGKCLDGSVPHPPVPVGGGSAGTIGKN
jgi:hypothetical protein